MPGHRNNMSHHHTHIQVSPNSRGNAWTPGAEIGQYLGAPASEALYSVSPLSLRPSLPTPLSPYAPLSLHPSLPTPLSLRPSHPPALSPSLPLSLMLTAVFLPFLVLLPHMSHHMSHHHTRMSHHHTHAAVPPFPCLCPSMFLYVSLCMLMCPYVWLYA